MTIPDIPSDISYSNGQSAAQYFKDFANILNVQALTHKDDTYIRYFTKSGFKTLSYSQEDHISTNLACEWASKVQNVDVISYIGDRSVNYVIILLAIVKLRVTIMTISPDNSEAANVNLLEKTQASIIIADNKYESIAKSSASQVPGVEVAVVDPLDIEALLQKPLNPSHKNILKYEFSDTDLDKTVFIMYSSGSTSFPKAIFISNNFFINVFSAYCTASNGDNDKFKLDEHDTTLPCVPM